MRRRIKEMVWNVEREVSVSFSFFFLFSWVSIRKRITTQRVPDSLPVSPLLCYCVGEKVRRGREVEYGRIQN